MVRGKEIKLELSDKYNISIGTVDGKNPKSVYITISAWFEPINMRDNISYGRVISSIDRKIMGYLTDNINEDMFSVDQIMVDLDMRESGIKVNKKSYMCCEITLHQNTEILPITSEILINNIKSITSGLLRGVFYTCDYFKFNKTKKPE